MLFIVVTLFVFHFEISGKDNKEEHPSNMQFALVTLLIPFNLIFNLLLLLLLI